MLFRRYGAVAPLSGRNPFRPYGQSLVKRSAFFSLLDL